MSWYLNMWILQHLNLWMSAHNNMQMSWLLIMWLSTSQQCLDVTAQVTTPQLQKVEWALIFLLNTIPQNPIEILAHRNVNFCRHSALLQISTGSHTWRDTCWSFATIHQHCTTFIWKWGCWISQMLPDPCWEKATLRPIHFPHSGFRILLTIPPG